MQYDDVLNKQREIIYNQRAKVLNGEDISDIIKKMMSDVVTSAVNLYLPEEKGNTDHENWDIAALKNYFLGWVLGPNDLKFTDEELAKATNADIEAFLQYRVKEIYAAKEERIPAEIMRDLERYILLRKVDGHWMDHIDAMEDLKRGIGLRSYAQKDPVVEYTHEGFEMFDEMISSIQKDTVKDLMCVEIRKKEENPADALKKEAIKQENLIASHGDGTTENKPIRVGKKVGRNDPCPCGSGKKYKKCCGQNE